MTWVAAAAPRLWEPVDKVDPATEAGREPLLGRGGNAICEIAKLRSGHCLAVELPSLQAPPIIIAPD